MPTFDRRKRISDFLMTHHFHVFDATFSSPTVLTPAYGFRDCTAPEVTVREKEVKEGTFEYPRTLVMGADVSPITFSQGARFFNTDFYEWIVGTIRGRVEQRKNLVVVQYSQMAVDSFPDAGGLELGFTPLTDIVSRIPARAWLLVDCIPTSYKAATDFDAMGADISLASLTVKPYYFEEFATGSPTGNQAGPGELNPLGGLVGGAV